MSDESPIIEVDDVTFGYDQEVILDHVCLTVGPRDFLAIIGPNGGGKTTLLEVMLGLLVPWRGRVRRRFSGRRGSMGYVPQFATFEKSFPLKVHDVVRMGRLGIRGPLGRYRRRDEQAVETIMRRMGLESQAQTPVGDLSGGQLQRVLIARALAGEPEILILDEPLASVDAEFREILLQTLLDLHRHMPVVVVTHDLTPFAGVVEQIACVNRRLHYHPGGALDAAMLEEVYGCPVELVTHGVPHRVLGDHQH